MVRSQTGFAGAGAFSDGKLSLSPDVGGTLPEILGYEGARRTDPRGGQTFTWNSEQIRRCTALEDYESDRQADPYQSDPGESEADRMSDPSSGVRKKVTRSIQDCRNI